MSSRGDRTTGSRSPQILCSAADTVTPFGTNSPEAVATTAGSLVVAIAKTLEMDSASPERFARRSQLVATSSSASKIFELLRRLHQTPNIDRTLSIWLNWLRCITSGPGNDGMKRMVSPACAALEFA